jgi:hypothetical protein
MNFIGYITTVVGLSLWKAAATSIEELVKLMFTIQNRVSRSITRPYFDRLLSSPRAIEEETVDAD